MSIWWTYLDYLERKGAFKGGNKRVLDVGAQNLFGLTAEEALSFLRRYNVSHNEADLPARAEKLSLQAAWPPTRDSLFLRDALEGTSLDYTSFDIFPGPRVEIFDLNFQQLQPDQREKFDVVLNFGTTEHVFNQYNCFKVIHEAAKPGAYFFHQVPCSGFMDHGYWIYSPRMFFDLAEANDYEVCAMWCTSGDEQFNLLDRLSYIKTIRDRSLPQNHVDIWEKISLVDGLINAVLRKRGSGPFKLSLDITTSVGGPDDAIVEHYFGMAPPSGAQSEKGKVEPTKLLRLFTARQLATELSWRIRRRLGFIKS